ncbi:MAG: YicC family protein [Clostridia bacterium]|nr:YicC family protein [Clostridia bacterium]
MTGYGRSTIERDGRTLTVELKSVNHRFLDIAFRMPRSFSFLEDAMRRQIGAALSRGHVDVFVTYRNMREDARVVTVNEALVGAYIAAGDAVMKNHPLTDDRTLSSLLSMPDVLTLTEAEEDQQALGELTQDALGQALDALRAMRLREGEALKRDLAQRVDLLEDITRQIEARYPDTVAEYRDRLRARVEELLGDAMMDPQRLLQEVAIMADRSAIAEETVRLHSHFAQVRSFLDDNNPIGRKLDFIVQELNREVNTISSKSQDVPITNLVVSAKAEIEKVREQVQNVE